MSIDLFANLSTMQRCLDYQLRRHSVLASNVANAETPGYKPLDVSFDSVLTKATQLRTAHPAHMHSVGGDRHASSLFEDPADSPGNDGNAVSMEREMGKIVANSQRYRASVEMISRRLSLLKYAATDGTRR